LVEGNNELKITPPILWYIMRFTTVVAKRIIYTVRFTMAIAKCIVYTVCFMMAIAMRENERAGTSVCPYLFPLYVLSLIP
jgi:hypothetical protein